jgi:hypothetical protein
LGNEGLFPQHFQEQVMNHIFRRSMIQTVGTRIGHQRRAVADVQRFHFVPCEPCCLQRLLLKPFKLQTYDTRSAPFCLRPFRIRSSSSAKYWPLRCSAARVAADFGGCTGRSTSRRDKKLFALLSSWAGTSFAQSLFDGTWITNWDIKFNFQRSKQNS